MRVLVVGAGGREHALAWKLASSPKVEEVLAAPGNAGIASVARLAPVPADDLEGLARLAERERIDLTVVGPEQPLSLGLVDLFEERGLRAFGPSRAAAQLEASKAFAKRILGEAGIPTAEAAVCSDAAEARRQAARLGFPVVVKADGLAAGKGVAICANAAEAERAIDDALSRRVFGAAGERIVIEEFLEGEEASFLALTDGRHVLPLATAQDHKRIGEGDTGPNTGGMGAYSPAPLVTPALERQVVERILEPAIAALAARGILYRGVLYAGLMICSDGRARVLEFNVRFGDPECQPLMMRLASDLAGLLERTLDDGLADARATWDDRAAACVVLASAGYPGRPETGIPIEGVEEASRLPDVMVFHAGTRLAPDGRTLLTDGGRVLGVTALGATIGEAVSSAYRAADRIRFRGMQMRRDIGYRAIGRGV